MCTLRSSLRRLFPIRRTLRACATITSCPNSLNHRLTHGECIPVSSAIRLRGILPNRSRMAFGVVLTFCSTPTSPVASRTHTAVVTSRVTDHKQFTDSDIMSEMRRMETYVKQNGSWLRIARQWGRLPVNFRKPVAVDPPLTTVTSANTSGVPVRGHRRCERRKAVVTIGRG